MSKLLEADRFHRNLAIRKSQIHGYGVFACKPFKKGDYIATVMGSRIEYKSYFRGQSNRYANWIGYDKDRWIDPVDEFQYINHSSNPNAGLRGGDPLKAYALRDIGIDDEVTIDYSTIEADEEFYFENLEHESSGYRPIIGPIHTLPIETYKSYLPFIPSYFQKVYKREVLSKKARKHAN